MRPAGMARALLKGGPRNDRRALGDLWEMTHMSINARRTALLAVVAAVTLLVVALVIGDGARADATGPSPAPLTETAKVICHTNATGYCAIQHGLGQIPDTALLTPTFYPGTTPYFMALTSSTATALGVRAVFSSTTPVANADIEFSYAVFGRAAPPATTTTTTPPRPTTTTTTSRPPATTTTTALPPTTTTALPPPTTTTTTTTRTTTTTTTMPPGIGVEGGGTGR